MKFSIKVRHSITAQEADALNETGYLVSFEILETNIPDFPIELFLFRRVESQKIHETHAEPNFFDNFVTVCTLSDVFEYPTTPCREKNYFRKAKVRGIRPSLEEANATMHRMEDLLASLLRSVKLIHNNLVEVERVIEV